MQHLHLVGFTAELDGLIFSTRRGSKSGGYVVSLDDRLLDSIREAVRLQTGAELDLEPEEGSPAPVAIAAVPELRRLGRVHSALSPKDIQARLRAGRSVAEVADEAEVDESWILRFASPVLAEQSRIVERALQLPCRANRKGESAEPLDVSVTENLVQRGTLLTPDEISSAWSAYHVRDSAWVVRFRYVSRRRQQVAQWAFDLADSTLVPINRLATELGYLEPGRRKRRVGPADVVDDRRQAGSDDGAATVAPTSVRPAAKRRAAVGTRRVARTSAARRPAKAATGRGPATRTGAARAATAAGKRTATGASKRAATTASKRAATNAAKATRTTRTTKAAEAAKATRTTKATKATKAAEAAKATRTTKATKATRTTKAAKAGKAARMTKAAPARRTATKSAKAPAVKRTAERSAPARKAPARVAAAATKRAGTAATRAGAATKRVGTAAKRAGTTTTRAETAAKRAGTTTTQVETATKRAGTARRVTAPAPRKRAARVAKATPPPTSLLVTDRLLEPETTSAPNGRVPYGAVPETVGPARGDDMASPNGPTAVASIPPIPVPASSTTVAEPGTAQAEVTAPLGDQIGGPVAAPFSGIDGAVRARRAPVADIGGDQSAGEHRRQRPLVAVRAAQPPVPLSERVVRLPSAETPGTDGTPETTGSVVIQAVPAGEGMVPPTLEP